MMLLLLSSLIWLHFIFIYNLVLKDKYVESQGLYGRIQVLKGKIQSLSSKFSFV